MKILFTSLLFISITICQAQDAKEVKTFFFKNQEASFGFDERKVDNIDSADFIRTISVEKNNENLYDVTDYYLNKEVKSIGSSINKNAMPSYSGNVIGYYKNGKKQSEELYIKGNLLGNAVYYNQNSTIKKKASYSIDEKKRRIEKIEELNDSLGKPYLNKEGTGFYKEIDENGQIVEGEYLNGLKNKEWKTVNSKNNETYYDEYDNGEYLRGKTIDVNGKTLNYDDMEKLPEFNGGVKDFGSFLGKSLRYPPKARDNNIQGRVYLSFVVDKEGDLQDLKVMRGVDEELDNEALRVMKMSPKWNPGTKRGKPVRVSYTIPVFFQLQSSEPRVKHFGSYRQ
jgi:TonB family protein